MYFFSPRNDWRYFLSLIGHKTCSVCRFYQAVNVHFALHLLVGKGKGSQGKMTEEESMGRGGGTWQIFN